MLDVADSSKREPWVDLLMLLQNVEKNYNLNNAL